MILCDNQTSCTELTKGSTRCEFFAKNVYVKFVGLAALFEFEIKAKHVSGISNRLADLLSRCHLNCTYHEQFVAEFGNGGIERSVSEKLFDYSADW